MNAIAEVSPLAIRRAEAIRFTHFIVHIVDRETGVLEKTDLETPLDDAFPAELFRGHIMEAVSNADRRLARFGPKSKVAAALATLGAGGAGFVAASQAIADRFDHVMSTSRWKGTRFEIKPGDLLIAQFENAEEPGTPESRLAILKIDPLAGAVRRIRREGGKIQVVFEKTAAIIPTVEATKIHKIALVAQAPGGPGPFDLLLLDSDLQGTKVAQFFYRDFLESDLLRGSGETTQILRDEVLAVLPRLAPGEQMAVLRAADATLEAGAPLPLREFAARSLSLPGRETKQVTALRDELVARFQKRSKPEERIAPDETVLPAPERARKLAEKITFKLDEGLRIEVRSDALERLKADGRFEISPEPDALGRTKITIRSNAFKIVR